MLTKPNFIFGLQCLFLLACGTDDTPLQSCPESNLILDQFTQPTGEEYILTSDGQIYQVSNGECENVGLYFDEGFREENYLENEEGAFLIAGNDLIKTKNEWIEDFETYPNFNSLFLLSIQDSSKFWSTMTLQSPATPTVSEYVDLRNCIFDGSCDFIDNKIELAQDPIGSPNQCLKFTNTAPAPDMVTAKSSIQSGQQFFELGDELWFECRFFIENAFPFSLVDLENRLFDGSPGPRLVISNDRLAIENKFGAKDFFRHDKNILVPLNQWFTVKLHFKFDHTSNGLIELWQDDTLLFSVNGKNLPTSNSIQNSLEIGISASSDNGGLYIDDMRISESPF